MMPKIDVSNVAKHTGTSYPAPYDAFVAGRTSQALGDAGGLTQFGANLTTLAPNAKSSLRHWHRDQDEFVVVTKGVVTLVDDHGETELVAGDCAAFPAGDPNGHHFINKTDQQACFIAIGTRTETEICTYSDVDLKVEDGSGWEKFTRKDGSDL
jgi:uncharacterized cupin superfamily protein